MISDSELSRVLKIPLPTLNRWKKKDSDRYILYRFLKTFTKEDVDKRLDVLELDKKESGL